MTNADAPSRGFTRVREIPDARLPALVHPEWLGSFPWLRQGTTVRGDRNPPFDLGLFSTGSTEEVVLRHWAELLEATGARSAIHAQQVHEATVRCHARDAAWDAPQVDAVDRPGIPVLVEPCDGHVTGQEGVLLAVTVADCVPVFVVDPTQRAVGALHAGWRGTAGGVVEAGLSLMTSAFGSRPGDLHVHLGPSICAACYEVGPEVFEALEQPMPGGPKPIDLRTIVAERAFEAGVEAGRITISAHCTRCTDSDLFSHRGGDAGRQVGYVSVIE